MDALVLSFSFQLLQLVYVRSLVGKGPGTPDRS